MSSGASGGWETDSSFEGSYEFENGAPEIEYSELSYSTKDLRWQLQTVNPEFSHVQTSYLPAHSQIEVDQVVKSLLRRIWKTACYRLLILTVVVFIIFFIYYSIQKNNRGLVFDAVHESKSERYVQQHLPTMQLQSSNESGLHNRTTYTILIWNMPGTVHKPKTLEEKCGPCVISTDRKMAKQSHAIVIHYRDTKSLPDVQTRHPSQIYVWLCRESPKATKNDHKRSFKEFDNFFNATMTYRRDSDVYYPYSESWIRIKSNKTAAPLVAPFFQDSIDEIVTRKRHLVAWVVSNCFETEGAEERFRYVSRLQRAGLKADLFGRCYQNNPFPPYRSDAAIKKLSHYKFYLAFENSRHCRDYVTEKFWYNSLYSGVVPIVWGPTKEDLKKLAPPHSYINTEDFQSDKDLISYIKYLDKNDDAYKRYFEWRKIMSKGYESDQVKRDNLTTNSIFSKNATFGFCALCRALHSGRARSFGAIPSLNAWWYGSENPECLT